MYPNESAEPAQRVTLGRILRPLRKVLPPTRGERIGAHVCGVAMVAIFGLLAWFCHSPDESPWFGVVAGLGMWAMIAIVDIAMCFPRNYELQLLPTGVRVSSWGKSMELIEPTVVGGSWLRWSQSIRLQAGEQTTRISLGAFNRRRHRAAIVAHLSQFLSAEQQAEFGSEWVREHNELIMEGKFPWRRLLLICGVTWGIGVVVIVGFVEGTRWQFGVFGRPHSPDLINYYWTVALAPPVFVGGFAAIISGSIALPKLTERMFGKAVARKWFGPTSAESEC